MSMIKKIVVISMMLPSLTYAQNANVTNLHNIIPTATVISDEKTDITNLHQVNIDGELAYLSEDGNYLIMGSVIDLRTGRDLTDNRKNIQRKEALASVPESEMIIYTPNETKYTITVFSDPTCPWCRKFHSELQSFLDAGIKVRYLGFPRGGLEDEAAVTLVSVYCSQNKQKALNQAFHDIALMPGTCTAADKLPLHYELAQRLGVEGTPNIILTNGKILPGYVSLEQLMSELKQL